jgi:murein endopeptidase
MNLYAQWVIIKCFLDDPLTQKIFIERSRVKALKRYVKRIYKKRPAKLKTYLKFFPGGKKRVISSDQVHKSHMHVRIHCPPHDRRCSG